jgi:hypothetical protein
VEGAWHGILTTFVFRINDFHEANAEMITEKNCARYSI